MSAATRYRLLVWPVVGTLIGGAWWGLTRVGVPWWAVPLGLLGFLGFLTLVGLWVGAVENAHKARKAERETAERETVEWDEAALLLAEEENRRGDA